jgi:hypothetical protein
MKGNNTKTILSDTGRLLWVIGILLSAASCEDFIKIEPPRTDLVKSTVFAGDATANAAMLDVYYQMRSFGFASGTVSSITFYGALSSDEIVSRYASTSLEYKDFKQFNDNAILPDNYSLGALWSDIYKCIYRTNSILEGVAGSTTVSDQVKKQLTGEAKFIRAFCHFYLVNMFGDVPLILTTDYVSNSSVSRATTTEVYDQIETDLLDAKQLLPADYAAYSNQRVRPNASSASALLARVYLYREKWIASEAQASEVIANSGLYALTPLTDIFKATSTEPIFQLWREYYPSELFTFANPGACALTTDLVDSFEPGDLRRTQWIIDYPAGGQTIQLAFKYHVLSTPNSEFSTALRLAELYLIRAEARAQQNNVTEGRADLDAIRSRAGLTPSNALDQTSLLADIEQERRIELFTEWGHRWFDLKRTGRANNVLPSLKPLWTSTAALYPLPESELRLNSSLSNAQNPGY